MFSSGFCINVFAEQKLNYKEVNNLIIILM